MYANVISKDLEDFLAGACELYDIEMMPDYSGRFMFGQKCLAFVFGGTAGELISAFYTALTRDEFELKDELMEMFSRMRQDNMGLDYVYYFPGFQIEEE